MSSPLDQYKKSLENGDLKPDAQQERAAKALDELFERVLATPEKRGWFSKKREPLKGLYIYGGVGRGKSMLMDVFYEALPPRVSKRRAHFHEFMIGVHEYMHERRTRGTDVDKALPHFAKRVAEGSRILCFDEFHVTDIADAMILGRLFTHFFEEGVVVVATSNWVPDKLYEGGLQRDRFLPFIELLKKRMDILHLDSPTDYRGELLAEEGYYFTPLNEGTRKKMEAAFALKTRGASGKPETLSVKGHEISIEKAYERVAMVSFAQLCERPYGAEDYIEIAKRYDTLLLHGVPKLTYDRRNEAKRLMILIDALYEADTEVYISAATTPDKLYSGHDHAFEFDRTISRLNEMQSAEYIEKE